MTLGQCDDLLGMPPLLLTCMCRGVVDGQCSLWVTLGSFDLLGILPLLLLCVQGRRGRPVQLVDVPGHPKIRGRFRRYADQTRAIVFVVDSVDFMPQKTDIAESATCFWKFMFGCMDSDPPLPHVCRLHELLNSLTSFAGTCQPLACLAGAQAAWLHAPVGSAVSVFSRSWPAMHQQTSAGHLHAADCTFLAA